MYEIAISGRICDTGIPRRWVAIRSEKSKILLHVPFTDILRVFRLFEQDILRIMTQIKIFSIVCIVEMLGCCKKMISSQIR